MCIRDRNVPLRLTGKNICSILSIGESQNSQLSGEVHTPVGPQTFMGLVGHHNHPKRREPSMKVFSIWRCAGSAGVRLSVESGKDANERLCRDHL